jgi:hypothetical protein
VQLRIKDRSIEAPRFFDVRNNQAEVFEPRRTQRQLRARRHWRATARSLGTLILAAARAPAAAALTAAGRILRMSGINQERQCCRGGSNLA